MSTAVTTAPKPKKVRVIPPRSEVFSGDTINRTVERRVAAYCRVSTDHEEQQNSYDAQVEYYTKYIAERSDWEFVGGYTDEGTPYRQNPKSP